MAEAKIDVKSLKIGFIPGTGNMGRGLARNHAKAGNEVLVGSRTKDSAIECAAKILEELKEAKISGATNSEVAQNADILFFCPSGPLEERSALLKSLAPYLKNKIVVDVTNIAYFTYYFADKWGQVSSTDLCAEVVPDAKWVCAYKNTFAQSLRHPIDKSGLPLEVLVAGDESAKEVVIKLINATKFRALDAGGRQHIRIIELMGPPWIRDMDKHCIDGSQLGSWRFR